MTSDSTSKVIARSVIILFLASVMAMPTLGAQENEPSFLRADGFWIKDADGNVVLLRGTNYMGMEFGWFLHAEDDFRRIRSWGMNVVRLPIAWRYLEPSEGLYDSSYLDIIERVVSYCRKYGLYVILDMHQWNWAPRFQGNGLPDWATYGQVSQDEAKARFMRDSDTQRKLANAWKVIASKYSNDSIIAAYDLFNEANVNFSLMARDEFRDSLRAFYEMLIDAIREVDPNHMIMLEPMWGNDVENMPAVDRSNIVLSTHLYTGGTWDGTTGYAVTKDELERDFLRGYQLARARSIPLFVGEFGVGSRGERAAEWVRDYCSIFDKYCVGSAWWTFWRDDSSFGLLTVNGVEKTAILDQLSRIYPKKTSVPPSDFSFDLEKGEFVIHWGLASDGRVTATLNIPKEFIGRMQNFTTLSLESSVVRSETAEMDIVGRGEDEAEFRVVFPAKKEETSPRWLYLASGVLLLVGVAWLLTALSRTGSS